MSSTANLLLGIDGGGTKTECWLARSAADAPEVDVIGKGYAEASNPRAIGIEPACAVIERAIAGAFRDAGLERMCVRACVLGLAGAGREEVRQAIADWAATVRLADGTDVIPDFELPLAAAANDQVGVALISGTGSVAFGRNARGETARVGGWGYVLGDSGSAYSIGREALHEACKSEDGLGIPTSLTGAIPRHFHVDSIREAADRIYASPDPRRTIAELCPLVFAESERGDTISGHVIGSAHYVLSEMVTHLATKLELDGTPFPLALSGSVLTNNPAFVGRVVTTIGDELTAPPHPVCIPEPVAGAVQMALRRLRSLCGQKSADGGAHRPGG